MSDLENTLSTQLSMLGLPLPIKEHRFHNTRKWRFDFAWPDKMLAVEIDGATWSNGRHNRGKGYASDCVKLNTAVAMGWRVLRFTGQMVRSGEAVQLIEQLLDQEDAA